MVIIKIGRGSFVMHEEFKKIMSFFSLDQEKKAEHLDEVFSNSIDFFEKFKHILESGTPEEKQQIMNEVMQLQEKLQQETEKMCHDTGLSESELRSFAQNRANFSEEEWASIQQAKGKLEKQAEALAEVLPHKKGEESQEKKGAPKPKKSKWMKS